MGRNSGISWNGKVLSLLTESDEIVLDSPGSCALLRKISSVIDTFDAHSGSNLQSS